MGNEGSKSFSGSETKEEESLSTELKDKLHLHDQSCGSGSGSSQILRIINFYFLLYTALLL